MDNISTSPLLNVAPANPRAGDNTIPNACEIDESTFPKRVVNCRPANSTYSTSPTTQPSLDETVSPWEM
jgi:hypothetical protein